MKKSLFAVIVFAATALVPFAAAANCAIRGTIVDVDSTTSSWTIRVMTSPFATFYYTMTNNTNMGLNTPTYMRDQRYVEVVGNVGTCPTSGEERDLGTLILLRAL